ncbi:MAG TPA: adenosylcobinamide-GDP ribazoletransferase [bacterium]|jgi:adenosylcobinamide-GDP ribazoletransferase|nr:adenosylcobinamide-GDP ribazoletransferase [bacterium]
MRSLLLALQFLTRYPVRLPDGYEPGARELGRATRCFPLVGLFVGLDLLLLRFLLQWMGVLARWPLAAAVLLLGYWVWSCDSLHLDGLSDTTDGLASHRLGPDMLAVMHDSRSGAFGVQATVLVLALKGAWLASLPLGLWWALPLPLLFSRLLAALLCQARPYAGRQGSLSGGFIEGALPEDGHAAVAFAFLGFAALAGAAVLSGLADALDCFKALAVCLAAMAAGWSLVMVPRRRLGGVSGDLIGYGIQACEVAAAFGLLFLKL